jgi:hypothetical protein
LQCHPFCVLVSFVPHPPAPAIDPAHAQALTELVSLGLRMARVVTEVAEAEQRTVAAVTSWLPAQGITAASNEDAIQIGMAIDGADEALAHATPRIAMLARCLDQVSRSVRRTLALARRLEQGWPPRAPSDSRRAMLLRQATRDVGETIRARTQGDAEATERLFADLAASLDDPAFEQDLLERPVEEMVQILCREIGLPHADAPAGTDRPPPPGRRHEPG